MPNSPNRSVPGSPGTMMRRSSAGRALNSGGLHSLRKHPTQHPVRKLSANSNGVHSSGNVTGICGSRGVNISSRNTRSPGWKKRGDVPRAKGRSMREGSIVIFNAEQINKKVTNLLQEYYVCCDTNEARLCVEELDEALYGDNEAICDAHIEVVYFAIFYAFENGSERQLQHCVQLMHSFLEKNVISDHQIKKGLSKVCSMFNEICLDIPVAPKHLAFVLSGLLMKHHLNLTQICSLLSPLTLKTKKRRIAINIALNTLANIKDKKEIVAIYKSCLSQGSVQCLVSLLPAENRSQASLSNIIRQNKNLSVLIPHIDIKE